MQEPIVISEDDALWAIVEQLRKLNENVNILERTINEKFGGDGANNLNVTLFTDDPIQVKQDKEEK